MHKTTAAAVLSFLFLAPSLPASEVQANDLALGRSAKTASVVEIGINPPVDLNFKTKAQIFELRDREIRKHAELLHGSYSLSPEVFGQMVDGQPWWGTLGMAFHGPGRDSVKGPAEESRFIVNPFLLVGQAGIVILGKSVVTEAQLSRTAIPVFIQPSNLRWWAREGRAEVTYEYSDYERQICRSFGFKRFPVTGAASLEAINARDLGLSYIFIPAQQAVNLKLGEAMSEPRPIPQFIHCGGTCGYPGGCNNMSPATSWLDKIEISSLPARLVILLWRSRTATEKEPANMTYTITFR